jgi:hypothetical protein
LYLKQTRQKNGRVSISITQAYRDADRKPRNRTVRNFGYLDELEKTMGPDALGQCRAICAQMTEQAEERHAPVSVTIHPGQKIDRRCVNRRNIGCAVPLFFYNSLGVEGALRSVARKRSARFDVNAVMRLLVIERLLNPGSKLSAWQNRGSYFFRSDFSDDDVYRSLDILAAGKARVIAAMNRSIERMGLRASLNTVFYDVTNYYFEVDDPDELRCKGVSKEHRPDPIVQMGLLQDAKALPISYQLFPGNTNDCSTMMPVLDELKDTYGLGRIVIVADKGLNCSTNIAINVAEGNGFIFSQSIRGKKSSASLRGWVCSEEGYVEHGDEGFRMKSRQDMKRIHLKAEDTADGLAKDVDVDVKIVAFWSRRYAERARHEREETIRRARELVASPAAYSAATHYGAARYVRGLQVDTDTGELLDTAETLIFDEERLAAEEACDGYYCIITSETDMPDGDIVETYRGLWRIEESFKITKSCLQARPVYVRTPEHIEAHFLTCYIALCIMRLMQLAATDTPSADALIKDLGKLSGSAVEDNWWLFDYRSDLTEEMFSLIGAEHPTRFMRLADIKRLLSKKR